MQFTPLAFLVGAAFVGFAVAGPAFARLPGGNEGLETRQQVCPSATRFSISSYSSSLL